MSLCHEHWHDHFKPSYSRQILLLLEKLEQSFRSVVVITCASHAQGPRFEPGRKQIANLLRVLPLACPGTQT